MVVVLFPCALCIIMDMCNTLCVCVCVCVFVCTRWLACTCVCVSSLFRSTTWHSYLRCHAFIHCTINIRPSRWPTFAAASDVDITNANCCATTNTKCLCCLELHHLSTRPRPSTATSAASTLSYTNGNAAVSQPARHAAATAVNIFNRLSNKHARYSSVQQGRFMSWDINLLEYQSD